MEKGKESEGKLEELQLYEQNLQNLVLQKQILQADLNEINSALKEVAKSKDECFKIVGGIMIKIPKDEIIKDLEEKKKLQE
ncbi:MAG: prefoldin subunit, partial [Candidatus Pacearchaeota archaeon]